MRDLEGGESPTKIARKYKLAVSTVHEWKKSLNLPSEPESDSFPAAETDAVPEARTDDLVAEMEPVALAEPEGEHAWDRAPAAPAPEPQRMTPEVAAMAAYGLTETICALANPRFEAAGELPVSDGEKQAFALALGPVMVKYGEWYAAYGIELKLLFTGGAIFVPRFARIYGRNKGRKVAAPPPQEDLEPEPEPQPQSAGPPAPADADLLSIGDGLARRFGKGGHNATA